MGSRKKQSLSRLCFVLCDLRSRLKFASAMLAMLTKRKKGDVSPTVFTLLTTRLYMMHACDTVAYATAKLKVARTCSIPHELISRGKTARILAHERVQCYTKECDITAGTSGDTRDAKSIATTSPAKRNARNTPADEMSLLFPITACCSGCSLSSIVSNAVFTSSTMSMRI